MQESVYSQGSTTSTRSCTDELSGTVAAFKEARLFLPHKVDEMKPDASAIDTLIAFPFLDDVSFRWLKTRVAIIPGQGS